MKAIILAGGYAKRLWPLTKDTPKPLLEVGGKEIITRIIEKLDKCKEFDELIISTNAKFEKKFKDYISNLKTDKKVILITEPTLGEGEKLGAIGGLNFLIDHLKIKHDVLIIGGDNIFEFDVKEFLEFHKKNNASVVALKNLEDIGLLKQYGLCVVDKKKKIVEFQEKPEQPHSLLVATACYLFKLEDFLLIKKYLAEGNSKDASGLFVAWLIKHTNVCGFVFKEDWFDIGSFESLDEARKIYSKEEGG
ncbi:MAG: nucleotidyltransferase family protein [Nanoarchaeota archaeon]|nr:nucleotidyltransferase family protein [Nanoarchaeota archaeon]